MSDSVNAISGAGKKAAAGLLVKRVLGHVGDLGNAATRLGIGGYFLLAGWGKSAGEIENGLGSFAKGPGFDALQPEWLPDAFALPYGYVLPWAEVAVGLTLAVGLFTRISAALTFMMLLSFTIALALVHGIDGKEDGTPGGPFTANYIMLGASAWLVGVGGGLLSADRVIGKVLGKGK